MSPLCRRLLAVRTKLAEQGLFPPSPREQAVLLAELDAILAEMRLALAPAPAPSRPPQLRLIRCGGA